jgi:hypothetical protein
MAARFIPRTPSYYNVEKLAPDNVTEQFFNTIRTGDVEQIRNYVNKSGITVNAREKVTGNSAVHIALELPDDTADEDDKYEIVAYLFSIGAPIDTSDASNRTPLIIAINHQYYKIVMFLKDKHVRLHVKDFSQKNPLHYAVLGANTPCEDPNKVQPIIPKSATGVTMTSNNIDGLMNDIINKLQTQSVLNNRVKTMVQTIEKLPSMFPEIDKQYRASYANNAYGAVGTNAVDLTKMNQLITQMNDSISDHVSKLLLPLNIKPVAIGWGTTRTPDIPEPNKIITPTVEKRINDIMTDQTQALNAIRSGNYKLFVTTYVPTLLDQNSKTLDYLIKNLDISNLVGRVTIAALMNYYIQRDPQDRINAIIEHLSINDLLTNPFNVILRINPNYMFEQIASLLDLPEYAPINVSISTAINTLQNTPLNAISEFNIPLNNLIPMLGGNTNVLNANLNNLIVRYNATIRPPTPRLSTASDLIFLFIAVWDFNPSRAIPVIQRLPSPPDTQTLATLLNFIPQRISDIPFNDASIRTPNTTSIDTNNVALELLFRIYQLRISTAARRVVPSVIVQTDNISPSADPIVQRFHKLSHLINVKTLQTLIIPQDCLVVDEPIIFANMIQNIPIQWMDFISNNRISFTNVINEFDSYINATGYDFENDVSNLNALKHAINRYFMVEEIRNNLNSGLHAQIQAYIFATFTSDANSYAQQYALPYDFNLSPNIIMGEEDNTDVVYRVMYGSILQFSQTLQLALPAYQLILNAIGDINVHLTDGYFYYVVQFFLPIIVMMVYHILDSINGINYNNYLNSISSLVLLDSSDVALQQNIRSIQDLFDKSYRDAPGQIFRHMSDLIKYHNNVIEYINRAQAFNYIIQDSNKHDLFVNPVLPIVNFPSVLPINATQWNDILTSYILDNDYYLLQIKNDTVPTLGTNYQGYIDTLDLLGINTTHIANILDLSLSDRNKIPGPILIAPNIEFNDVIIGSLLDTDPIIGSAQREYVDDYLTIQKQLLVQDLTQYYVDNPDDAYNTLSNNLVVSDPNTKSVAMDATVARIGDSVLIRFFAYVIRSTTNSWIANQVPSSDTQIINQMFHY